MSAQFLEAVSKVPGALTEKAKKSIEDARRSSGSTPAQIQLAEMASNLASNASNASQPVPQNTTTPNTPKAVQLAQMSSNPAMLLQWIKNREDVMKGKFREF